MLVQIPVVHKGDAAQFGSSLVGIELRPLSIPETPSTEGEAKGNGKNDSDDEEPPLAAVPA